ncbi:MAG: preprotein translocase subunit SecE [Candidatus Nitrospinota bacterium M3_3B_026]
MEKLQGFIQYLREVRIETRKVTFPSRKDTMATTSVVIVVVLFISIVLGAYDWFLSFVLGFVI